MNTRSTTLIIIAIIVGITVIYYPNLKYKLGANIEPASTFIEKKYKINNISKIYSSDGIIVHYSQQDKDDILVKGPENVVSALKINKRADGLLKLEISIGDKFNYLSEKEQLHVWISKPNIHYFQAMSKSCIYITDTLRSSENINIATYSGALVKLSAIKAPIIELESYTGSNITVHSVKAETLKVKAFTKSTIKVFGVASSINYTASSASIDANNLYAHKGTALAMNEGSITSAINDADIKELTGGHISNSTNKKK